MPNRSVASKLNVLSLAVPAYFNKPCSWLTDFRWKGTLQFCLYNFDTWSTFQRAGFKGLPGLAPRQYRAWLVAGKPVQSLYSFHKQTKFYVCVLLSLFFPLSIAHTYGSTHLALGCWSGDFMPIVSCWVLTCTLSVPTILLWFLPAFALMHLNKR